MAPNPDSAAYLQFSSLHRPMIDQRLDQLTDFSVDACPPQLKTAIRYSLLAPGKRLRPLLVLAATEVCEGDVLGVMDAACAVEMIHASSLIHDDLPGMDNDDLRRGQPTNHKVHGEAQAILAGDALLVLAFEVLAKMQDPSVAVSCVAILSRASGVEGIAGGQSDDLAEERMIVTLDQLKSRHRRKTGALIRASLELGAILADASEAERSALNRFGEALGLLFQVTDDLLDVLGNEEDAGKRLGKDAEHGKSTFPVLLGIDGTKDYAQRLGEEAIQSLSVFAQEGEVLRALIPMILKRKN